MEFQVSVQDAMVGRLFTRMSRSQLPFAAALAVNDVAKQFQKAQQEGMADRFTLRRKQWAERNVKIKHFAKKRANQTFAEVGIVAPGGGDRSDILAKFEAGGVKRPKDGRSLAIPQAARRSNTDIIPKNLRPRGLHFKQLGVGPKATVFVGDRRTFLIKMNDNSGGAIFQRFGRGPARSSLKSRKQLAGVRVLYTFGKSAKIAPQLKFAATAQRVIPRGWPKAFRIAFRQALATAR